MPKSKCQIKPKATMTKSKRFEFWIFDLIGRLKFGFLVSQRGFTMVEIVVMLFVVMMVSAVVLTNFPGVSESINAQKSAQRLALSIRRAQSQALAVREVSVNGVEIIAPAFGIHIRKEAPTEYVFFADRNGDFQYREADDSLIERSFLARGVSFSDFRDEYDRSLLIVNIVFRAPGGDMAIFDAEGAIGESALITVRAGGDGASRSVRVRTSGQVAVE